LFVAGDDIDSYFEDKEVGDGEVAVMEGDHDGVCYNIWEMKEAVYITKIMSTASGLFFADEKMHSHCLEWVV